MRKLLICQVFVGFCSFTNTPSCEQTCADNATLTAQLGNLSFEQEATLFFICVSDFCNNP